MISTEADALFLKHCIEFLIGAKVEHDLFTDSSAARQLALRQAKHIAGKLFWIQDIVQSGQTMLLQILTVWNLADIGTKICTSKTHQGPFA